MSDLKNPCQHQLQGGSPLFSSRSFMAAGLTFKPLIHLDVDFGAWYKIPFFGMLISSVSNTTY